MGNRSISLNKIKVLKLKLCKLVLVNVRHIMLYSKVDNKIKKVIFNKKLVVMLSFISVECDILIYHGINFWP